MGVKSLLPIKLYNTNQLVVKKNSEKKKKRMWKYCLTLKTLYFSPEPEPDFENDLKGNKKQEECEVVTASANKDMGKK